MEAEIREAASLYIALIAFSFAVRIMAWALGLHWRWESYSYGVAEFWLHVSKQCAMLTA